LKDEFKNVMQDVFLAMPELCNFAGNASGETSKINKWVSDNTEQKITNLISNPLAPLTAIVLVNAIYFLGKWYDPFSPSDTSDYSFTTANGSSEFVDMMRKHGTIQSYGEEDGYKWINLPYENKAFSMTFIMPEKEPTVKCEEKFNKWLISKLAKGNSLDQLFPTKEIKLSTIRLPKFKIEFGVDLKEAFATDPFQMKSPFLMQADFANMTPKSNIYISAIHHKVFIDVNESGTEATAATAVVGMAKSRKKSKEKVYDFIADRPFTYILHHKDTGSILFIGKYNKP